ncbi:MAG: DUF814 domain-containing protein [Synechococcaceae bacterium WB9_4xB_025]|nr:DUF814 domain-containing protein [Synechococcaceae bacterium WB9_4xB_025]
MVKPFPLSASPQVMDLTALRAVLSDLRGRILPSRFEKAQQPDAHGLQLGFRTLKGMVWLELSWQAELARLVQIPPPRREGSGSTLAQQIQHSLKQLALVSLMQDGFERVVRFGFAPRPGAEIQRWLVLELMGRHSNLMLLDEQERVIALGRQVRDHQSRVRPISTGDPYLPPPPLQGIPPSTQESFERWHERLMLLPVPLGDALRQSYQGISPALARQLAHDDPEVSKQRLNQSVQELSEPEWRALHSRWHSWLRQLEDEHFQLRIDRAGRYQVWSGEKGANPVAEEPLSLRLGRHYRDQLERRQLEQIARELRQSLDHWREREERQLAEQLLKLKETEQATALQHQADALLCLSEPKRTEIDEAQKLYRRARKLRRAVPQLEERERHHQQRLQLIEGSDGFLEDLLTASWDEALERVGRLKELKQELEELLQPRQRSKRTGSPQRRDGSPEPLELRSPAGLTIQVGRNHRQNDWISLRQARPGDLWFHAQECPGSHVVLKASTGLAGEADLELAADLAALFSRARRNRRVPVVMVPVEQLQRIAGAGPGTVRHRGGAVRWAEPERAEQRLSAGELLA